MSSRMPGAVERVFTVMCLGAYWVMEASDVADVGEGVVPAIFSERRTCRAGSQPGARSCWRVCASLRPVCQSV